MVDDRSLPRMANFERRLLTFVETDGCGADGLSLATDCQVGRRTLRVLDYGKIAATLVDTWSGTAVRVTPSANARDRAVALVAAAPTRWQAYLEGYQRLQDDDLLVVRQAELTRPIEELLSRPDARAVCQRCGEEIINEREVVGDGLVLCRSCAGGGYYRLICTGD
jgi:formylmethanofuran dehydrogenase subunit E